ncbi:uncharacterized protein LOC144443554 [Glandiceps talaboti]
MASNTVDEDPSKADNIGCRAKILKLVEDLRGIVGSSEYGDHELEVKHLMDGIDIGQGLVQTCIKICTSLMTAVDELAIALNQVLSDINQKLPSDEDAPESQGSSSLKHLTEAAERFSSLINEALANAGSTKKMASALTAVSGAISSDLASADKLVEESVTEATQLADKCTVNADKLKVDIRLAQETIQIASSVTGGPNADENVEIDVSEIYGACEEAKDVAEDVRDATETLEKVAKRITKAIDEEHSPVYGTKIRQATEEGKGALEQADSNQRVLEKAVKKIKELVRGIEDIQQAQTSAKVKSGLEELEKEHEEFHTQLEYAQHIVDLIAQLASEDLDDSSEEIKKVVEDARAAADNARVIILPAKKSMKEFVEKIQEAENLVKGGGNAISETNLVELERLRDDCKPKCKNAKMAAKSAEIKMSKFIQSDPNRPKAVDACGNAKIVIEDTKAVAKETMDAADEVLGTTEDGGEEEGKKSQEAKESMDLKPQQHEHKYWQTEETMQAAERALQAGKKAQTAAERTTKLAAECEIAVADTVTFIDANLISNLIRRTKECEYATSLSKRSLEELEDTDPRNWPVLGLPPRVQSPLCVLRAPRAFIDAYKNRITCSYLERSPVSPAAANQKQVSMVVTPQLLATSADDLPAPAFLAIRYNCKNDFGGDIIVKSSKSRKKWSVLPTISTERRIDEFHGQIFAEVKVKSFESYAVLLRSVKATSTIDEKGGDVVMRSKHPLSISIQPGCLSVPTDVSLETATQDNATKTLKYADPFIRVSCAPKPKKAVRLTLVTKPPSDRSPAMGGQKNHLYCLYCADNKRWKVTAVLEEEQDRSPDGLLHIVLPPVGVNQQLLIALLWNPEDLEDLEENLSLEQGKGMSKEARERHIFQACLSDDAFRTLSKNLGDEVDHLAVYLQVGDTALQKIKTNNDSTRDQALQVLIRWRQKSKGENDKKVGLLRSALHKCKRLDMAQKVQNDLRDALNWGV